MVVVAVEDFAAVAATAVEDFMVVAAPYFMVAAQRVAVVLST